MQLVHAEAQPLCSRTDHPEQVSTGLLRTRAQAAARGSGHAFRNWARLSVALVI